MIRRASVVVLALLLSSGRVAAQNSSAYLELALGAARLDAPSPSFSPPIAPVPALAVGYSLTSGLFLEGRLSTTRGDATESLAAGGTEAPYTVGLRATLVEARAGMRPPTWRLGPLQPVASIGGIWARLTDTWRSDTPEEQYRSATLGVSAVMGIETALSRHATFAVSGNYRAWRRVEERPDRALELPAVAWAVSLRLRR